MVSNQMTAAGHAGYRATFEAMERSGELTWFKYVTPRRTASDRGHAESLNELLEAGEAESPDVLLIASPHSFGHDLAWVERLLRAHNKPQVIYWEGDPWSRLGKPLNVSMRAWLKVADTVFTHARQPHVEMFRKAGAREVRFLPPTYDHVAFGEAEATAPALDSAGLSADAVMIGSGLARWGRVSRIPGAVARAGLVRKLQARRDLRIALYGDGWSGRGAMGALPFDDQVRAIRRGLMSVNWDHFPRHDGYASNRLPISLLAGRVHLTTMHSGYDWPPGEEAGLFPARTVPDLLKRVDALRAAGDDEVLRLGLEGHRWVRGRLSNREAARFMLGAVDSRFLVNLPPEPWGRLTRE